MNLIERVASPTPTFFQKLRNIGLALTTISVAIIAAPWHSQLSLQRSRGICRSRNLLSGVSQITVTGDQ